MVISLNPSNDTERVLSEIIEALANNTRRKILEILVLEGPLTFSEILKKTSIKDTSTLKHHLEKMKVLIAKENGLYKANNIGVKVYAFLENLIEEINSIIDYKRNPTPLIVLKPSMRPYIILLLILLPLSVYTYVSITYIAGYIIALIALLILFWAIIKYPEKIIIGKTTIIQVIDNIFYRKERKITGKIVGVDVEENILHKVIGVSKIRVIIQLITGIRSYTLGYILRKQADNYVREIEYLLSSQQ